MSREDRELEQHRLPGWEKEIGSDRLLSLRSFARAVFQHVQAMFERGETNDEEA